MANPIWPQLRTGTIGELLVQLRLLQFGVQAAPPLKDSGNDLIALRGESVRTVQVKTTTNGVPVWPKNKKLYHLLAVVRLRGEGKKLFLDDTEIFLIPKSKLVSLPRTWQALEPFRMSEAHVAAVFA